jgi:hypothetical protein
LPFGDAHAAKSFGVNKAWRFWSLSDPAIHQATYQFADEDSLDRAMDAVCELTAVRTTVDRSDTLS